MAVSPSSKSPSSSQQKPPSTSAPPPSPHTKSTEATFLSSIDGEIAFFRSIMRARPVGIHRYFHILAIQNAIHKDTGQLLHVESLWEKLQSSYDLDALDAIDLEAEGYQVSQNNTSPVTIRSPSPSENLARHHFFREEYSLPFDETFENLISQRRMRATASAPSSPIASPAPLSAPTKSHRKGVTSGTGGGGRRRAKSRADLAGLVGGDSDSSALTQESADEAAAGTPRESVVTGTDGGTEFGDEEDIEMKEPSPAARSMSPKPLRGRPKGAKKSRGRPLGPGPTGASTRSSKKRKR